MKVSPDIQKLQNEDQSDARKYALQWNNLAAQRLAAAAQGSSSPWLGIQQWGLEKLALDPNIRGGTESNPQALIDQREAAFQAEKQRLLDLAGQGIQANPKSIWSGVR